MGVYERFWFATQVWLKRKDRRPYTYAMRDWYHTSPLPTIVGLAITFYMIGRYTTLASIWWLLGIVLALVVGIILGHLFWTKHYVEGEQENPQYLGEGNEKN